MAKFLIYMINSFRFAIATSVAVCSAAHSAINKEGLKPSPEVSQDERDLIQEELIRRGIQAIQH